MRTDRRVIADKFAHGVIFSLASSAVLGVFLILLFLLKEAITVFSGPDGLSLKELFGSPFTYQPVSEKPKYNVVPLIVGTLKISFVAIAIAFPLATLAAIYSSEFTGKIMRSIIKPVVELLASLPSVVLGFFALIYIASIAQTAFGLQFRLNAFTAGAGVAVLLLPTAFTLVEEALYLVPRQIREAGYALGGSKSRVLLRLVFRIALPGVIAALLLSFGRALGETMVVLMAAGNAASLSPSLFEPVRTLASNIGAEMAEVVYGSIHYHVLFFCGFVLLVFSMTLNFVSHLLVSRFAIGNKK